MKYGNKANRILATVGETDRLEIKGLIKQLEDNGARLGKDGLEMLVNMTIGERYKFLQNYQRH
jgi:hypothetical protein